jgi:hypothetical protein
MRRLHLARIGNPGISQRKIQGYFSQRGSSLCRLTQTCAHDFIDKEPMVHRPDLSDLMGS